MSDIRKVMNIMEQPAEEPVLPKHQNNYWFEFAEPTEVFVVVGRSESNTWIGNSRALNPVVKRVTFGPGDVLCMLFGAFRTIDDEGNAWSFMMAKPKPHLEKNYGDLGNHWNLEQWVKTGKARLLPAPDTTGITWNPKTADYPPHTTEVP